MGWKRLGSKAMGAEVAHGAQGGAAKGGSAHAGGEGMMIPSDTAFRGMPKSPAADRFRIGDVWSYNGIEYVVGRGIFTGGVCLKPTAAHRSKAGARTVHLRATSVEKLQRVKWGGQP